MLSRLTRIAVLPKEYQQAVHAAVKAQKAAYAPYTNFCVGAALVHCDNSITAGCNYENCTLQACCAERCAIVSANVKGYRTATAIAIYGGGLPSNPSIPTPATPPENVCPPCGLCRQLLVEVADLSSNYETFSVILVTHDQTSAAVIPLAELLPHKFGPADVGVDVSALRSPLA